MHGYLSLEEISFREEYDAVLNGVYDERRRLIQDKLDELKKLIEEK